MDEKYFKLDPKDADLLILRAEEGDDSSMDTESAEDSKSLEPSASFSPHKHHPPRNMALWTWISYVYNVPNTHLPSYHQGKESVQIWDLPYPKQLSVCAPRSPVAKQLFTFFLSPFRQ